MEGCLLYGTYLLVVDKTDWASMLSRSRSRSRGLEGWEYEVSTLSGAAKS